MRSLARDRSAVSPVIATILLVAITVVLASLLYLSIAGLLGPTEQGPRIMGVVIGTAPDGRNWTLTIVSTPLGLTAEATRLTVFYPNGSVALSKFFANLSYAWDGAAFMGTAGHAVSVGDRLVLDAERYPVRHRVQISDAISVLFFGELR